MRLHYERVHVNGGVQGSKGTRVITKGKYVSVDGQEGTFVPDPDSRTLAEEPLPIPKPKKNSPTKKEPKEAKRKPVQGSPVTHVITRGKYIAGNGKEGRFVPCPQETEPQVIVRLNHQIQTSQGIFLHTFASTEANRFSVSLTYGEKSLSLKIFFA